MFLKILLIHNAYGGLSGEEVVVRNTKKLLETNDHEVVSFFRSSAEIPKMRLGKARAFCSGIYSLSSKRAMRKLLFEHKPDIVHIHNLFSFISPSILGECTRFGVPVVMTVHNYRLICPNGAYFRSAIFLETKVHAHHWQISLPNVGDGKRNNGCPIWRR